MTNNTTKTLCIYHGNCPDGFAAAWAVRHALGDDVEFFAGIHQQAPPDVSKRHVLLVDFSYKREVLLGMLSTAASITILDHHVSAEKDLADLLSAGQVQGLFDMSKSGAMLAWEWFNPRVSAPKLIEHIQDRDLWQFKLNDTRVITTGLSSHPYEFDLWDKLMAGNKDELNALKRDGEAIERHLQQDIKQLIASGVRRMVIGGYDVPVLNASSAYVSDAGNVLSIGEPFAACYWDHATGRSFSLRASDTHDAECVDVSEVAKQYGGGGHMKAAGFTVDIGWEGD